jgi:hypothetical protein
MCEENEMNEWIQLELDFGNEDQLNLPLGENK